MEMPPWLPVACRTRSKKGGVVARDDMMGWKRRKTVVEDSKEVICVDSSSESEGGESGKNESGCGASPSASDAFMEKGFAYLGVEEDEPVNVVEINDDGGDGSGAEEELHCEKKSFEVKVEEETDQDEGCSGFGVQNESFEDEECGVRSDKPIVISHILNDDRFEYDSSSFSSESEDDDTSDDDFWVDDDGVESEHSSSEESDSSSNDDDEREGYSRMVKERVRKKKVEEEVEVEEEEETEEEVQSIGADCFGGKNDSVKGDSNGSEEMGDDVDQSQTQPSASSKIVPSISNFKKAEPVEISESQEEINMWKAMEMLLQHEGKKIADSTLVKKSGRNNNVNDKGKRVRRVSCLPKSQKKIVISSKILSNENKKEKEDKHWFHSNNCENKKEKEDKHWFHSNNRENKVRAVDDELNQVLRMPFKAKDRGLEFFTECFWGKQKNDNEVDQGELEGKDGDVDQAQSQPLAPRKTVPLTWDNWNKKPIEKSESEKELDKLWAEMEMALRAEEIGPRVDHTGTTGAIENEENNNECKHDLIEDEQIGRFCRWCGWVETDIKYMWPDFVNSERSGRRVSPAEGNTSRFDEEMFKGSGDNTEGVSSHNEGTVWDLIPDIKQSLYPHQQEGFEFIWKNLAGTTELAELKGVDPRTEGGCIISHAPGTGKTRLTMVFLQVYLRVFPKCLPVIVAPANILLTWEDELKKWDIGIPFYNMNNAELSGKEHAINDCYMAGNQQLNKDFTRMVKLCSWYKEKSILLISYSLYEKLAGGESENEGAKGRKKAKKGVRPRERIEIEMGKVLRVCPGLLILDEGHTPRNHRSCIWKVLSKSRTQKRILLSGTPFQNNFLELYNILRVMKPSFTDSIPQELKKFCQSRLMQQKKGSKDVCWELFSFGNQADDKINQLKLLMDPYVHVHKGSILQKNIPGLRDCVLVLKPDNLQQKILDSIETNQIGLNFEHKLALVSVHPSLFLSCSLLEKEKSVIDKDLLEKVKSDPYEGVKTKFLREFVTLCDAVKEKVLIFSQFIDTLSLIKDHFERAFTWSEGTELLYMHGKLDQKQKQALIHIFNDENSQAKVLLASIKACSEGINLIGASRVVLVDVVWNPSVERQAICRAYRLGQKKVVYTYHLLAQGTPECIKYRKQAEKDKLSELVFSNKNAENDKRKSCVEFEDAILDLLVQHKNLKDMFAECLVHPKDRDFETLGS